MFLFRDGSLTLMNRASFIALVRFWSSLPTIVKLLMLILWPVVLQWSNIGEGGSWCSLNLSAKFLADSPMYSSLHPCSLHLYLYMTPLLFVIVSLSLRAIRRLLMVCPPLKEHLNPKFLACPLYSLTKSLMVWDYHVQVCFVVALASLGSSCFVLVWVLALHSCPFNGPCGVFASCESFKEVFFFFLQ